MKKITKLTKEQETFLPVFRDEYLRIAIGGERSNRDSLESAIGDAYNIIGKDKPLVIILKSPLAAMVSISITKKGMSLKDQLGGQLEGQLGDQLEGQLGDQLGDQLWCQLRGQLRGQLRDQLRGQLRDQLWGQLRDQLEGQLGDQLWGQLGDQLGDQLWGQLWDQLRGQLRDQLWGQLRDQLWGQLRDQLWGQLGDQLGDQLWDPNFLWGSHDLYWIAWSKFAEYIGVKLTDDESKKLDIIYRIGHECEWWWPYEGICFVSERPIVTHWDDKKSLHSSSGPSILYEDGYSIYSWHGTRIPSQWITNPSSLTPEIALAWGNIEQRRAACEILGWDRILSDLHAVVINDSGDPEIGVLVEVEMPGSGKERFLQVICGTQRRFSLPVPPEMETALQANAWTYGLDEDEFVKPQLRT